MSRRVLVELNEDGSFTTHGRGMDCHLIYDPSPEGSRWLLLHSTNDQVDHPLSAHASLDEALVALVGAAHDDCDSFSVSLPSNDLFSRPGKLRAEEVLATLGYALVDGLSAYAVYSPSTELTLDEALRSFREMMHGYPVTMGSAAFIGDLENAWCCDFRVAFEGYVHRDAMQGYVESLLAGSGLEITEVIEYEDAGAEVPDESNVVAFPKAA